MVGDLILKIGKDFLYKIVALVGWRDILLGVIIIGIFFFYKYIKNKSAVSIDILKNEISLTIEDEKGEKVHYEKRQQFRPNHKWITGFIEHGILIEEGGRIEDFKVSPGKIVEIFERGGIKHLDIHFKKPLKSKREGITRSLEYDFRNCFHRNQEYFLHSISYPEKELIIRIIFPLLRPPHEGKIKTYLVKGAIEVEEKNLQIIKRADGRTEIVWTKKDKWWRHINIGDIYKIEWEW